MAPQENDLAQALRDRIERYPERSAALGLLAGYAFGGGLGGRISMQIALLAMEGLLGERLIPAIVSAADRRDEQQHSRNRD